MIGSEVRMVALTYQNFEVKYSTDGVIWSSYKQGWNLTNSFGDLSLFKLKRPFNAYYIRIVPEHWNMSLCSRYVIFGCANITATMVPTTSPCSGFTCNNSVCINSKWRCDGSDDCGDNTDEIGCPPVTCSDNQFTCNNSKCIGIDHVCDGDDDCGDTSDESPGCVKPTCTSSQFMCNTSRCIPLRFLCDGEKDCPGGEDEDQSNCPTTQPPACEFVCSDGTCISKTRICDYFKDCNNSMDEVNCTCTNTTQWRCSRSEKCISISYICDGTEECPQGEDEENCPTILPTTLASAIPSVSNTAQPVTHLTTTPTVITPSLCVRGNKVYNTDDTWTENECDKCRCLDDGSTNCTKFCLIISCPTGEVLTTSSSECCKCLRVTTTKPVTTVATKLTKVSTVSTTIPTPFVTTKAPVLGCINVTCSCPQTCADLARGSDNCSSTECKPGCKCPPGYVLQNGFCLNATTCPCYHEGKVYEFGKSYKKDVCITCMCLSHGFSCQKKCNMNCLPHEELVTLPDECCYCKQKCRADMIYKQCSCAITCENTTCDSTHCKPGCECPSDKYDDGTACVERKDCYCVINGQQVESGETWTEGHCTICSCTNGEELCNKTCNITSCPTGYQLVHPLDGCCTCIKIPTTIPITALTTPALGCYDNGTLKKIGETWSNDLCENCTCEEHNQVKCVSTTCPTVCPQGCKVKQTPGKCCNECVPLTYITTCEDNGVFYKAGETWKPDPCQNCSCSSDSKVTCRIEQCIKTCPVGFERRHLPGQCCPKCVPVSLCTMMTRTTVITDLNGCTSRNATSSFCNGPCNTNGTVSIIGNLTIISNCRCCKPTALARKSTPMICADGSSYLHYYPVIQQCSCTRCSGDTANEINQLLNSITAQNQG